MNKQRATFWTVVLCFVLVVLFFLPHSVGPDEYWASMSPGERARYKADERFLLQQVGEDELDHIKQSDEKASYERSVVKGVIGIQFFGFQALGIQNEILRKIWSDDSGAYPRGWVSNEIRAMSYIDEEKRYDSEYGEALRGETILAGSSPDSYNIYFWKDPSIPKGADIKVILEKLDESFAHEIGHLNNWVNDRDLSLVERRELLAMVLRRMDRAEEIPDFILEIDLDDERSETSLRADEYWAMMCEEYFSEPEWQRENYPEEYSLVDKQVKISNPDFDPIVAKKIRGQIILQAMAQIGS